MDNYRNPLNEPIDISQREKELAILLDENEYRKRRTSSEKKAAEFTVEDWKRLRKLAKSNIFFLTYTVLNYTKLSTDLHGDVCKWIGSTDDKRFRLLLLPRGHYKSTIYTIAHSIQSALPNDSNSNLWPYCLGTDVRICLMHETSGTASKFLSEIQNHFLANEFLMALFPECIPDLRKHTINMGQLELPRKSFWKEKTFEALGVGSRSQGNHYNMLKPDDLIGKEAKDSAIIMKATNDWVDNLQSFLTSFANPDHIDFTGTRWAHDDTWQHIIDTYGVAGEDESGQLYVYKRGAEEKVPSGKLDHQGNPIYEVESVGPDNRPIYKIVSIFPEEFPRDRLAILKKNKEIYSAQYLNDPESAESDLNPDKIRRYFWRNKESFIAFDNRAEDNVIFYHRELDKILLIDPAMSKNLGMVVTGTDRRNRTFVLDAIKKPNKTKEFINDVFSLVLKWQIRAVVFEKVLFSALYEPLFLHEMSLRGIRFKIIMHSVSSRQDKVRRIINSLSPYVEDGTLYVNDNHTELIKEFKRIGYSEDIHMIDALAMGPHYWKPFSGAAFNQFGQGSNYSSPVQRDATTGYTAM